MLMTGSDVGQQAQFSTTQWDV